MRFIIIVIDIAKVVNVIPSDDASVLHSVRVIMILYLLIV